MRFDIGIGSNLRTSPYFEETLRDGVASFSVYNHMLIPGNFGDPEAEYRRLIEGVAMWDVAAQRQVELIGPDAEALVQYLTPRSLKGLKPGQGRYVPMCNAAGHVINDPVLLKLDENRYWLSIADSDIGLWASGIAQARGMDVTIREPDVSPLAVQGPKAEDVVAALFGDWVRALGYFAFKETDLDGIPLVLARSGWSKQGGFELYLMDRSRGSELWAKVREIGAGFGIGPGAPNDQERIESGLASYGADFRHTDRPANPFELGMDRLVNLAAGHEFIGRAALEAAAETGPTRRWTGFFVEGAPCAQNRQPLDITCDGAVVGYLSEMIFSTRLRRMIGVGMIATSVEPGQDLRIEAAEGARTVTPTALPFLR